MQMAKADEQDLRAALDLSGILEDIDKGYFPRKLSRDEDADEPDDCTFFDEDDPKHLRALFDRIKCCLDAAPGGLFRVTFGMAVVLDPKNAIVDPDADYLKLHPRIEAALSANTGLSGI